MPSLIKKIWTDLQRLWNWLYAKRSEVSEMGYRDAYMAHIVMEIMQTSKKNGFKMIPLYDLLPIHPVDNRENTVKATEKRAEQIRKHRNKILKKGEMTKQLLAEILPSATYIRAIPYNHGEYFVFDGNGRIAALKNVFAEKEIKVEVDVYHPKKYRRSIRKLKKLAKMYEGEL